MLGLKKSSGRKNSFFSNNLFQRGGNNNLFYGTMCIESRISQLLLFGDIIGEIFDMNSQMY